MKPLFLFSRGQRPVLLASCVLVVLLAGSSCRQSPPAATPDSATELGQVDPCALLSEEEIGAVLGAPVRARLMVPTPDGPWPECRYQAGINRREEVLFLIWEPVQGEVAPHLLGKGKWKAAPEKQPGDPPIGQVARWELSGPVADLNVWRDSQLGFTLVLTAGTDDAGPLREPAIDLAAKVLERLDSPAPGRLAEVPPSQPPPFDVCDLLPLDDQLELMGWAPSTPPGSALEFANGIGSGSWECQRVRSHAELNIAVSKAPVPQEELAALGRPVSGTSPTAFIVDTARPSGPSGDAGSALLTTAPDGRMVEIVLYDRTDSRTRQAALSGAAKAVLSNLG